jgi:site-specific DNA recombinase
MMNNDNLKQELIKVLGLNKKSNGKKSHKNAVIYTRVSSNGQVNNASLDVQKRLCEEYASRNKYAISAYFGGTSESAKTEDRKEYKRMLEYIKDEKNEIGYVLVYDYTRFSRSGVDAIVTANMLYEEHGIRLIAVTQETDATDPSGKFLQSIMLLVGEQENDLRRKRTIFGMEEKLRQGHWFGKLPLGYKRIKVGNVIDYALTDEANKIRQAFVWRAEGLTVPDIRKRLKELGLNLAEKQLFKTFKNVYYCGFISHGLIPHADKIIKGRQPAIVDEETFLRANGRIFTKSTKGNNAEEIALKGHVICADCGRPLTGYFKKDKNKFYYKCGTKGCKLNKSHVLLNDLYLDLLADIAIERKLIPIIRENLQDVIKNNNAKSYDLIKMLETERGKLLKDNDTLRRRFALGEIDKEMYEEFGTKTKDRISELENQLNEASASLSNYENDINESLQFLVDLCQSWDAADIEGRIALQKCLFPNGVTYDREKHTYRTLKTNEFILASSYLSNKSEGNKKGEQSFLSDYSPLVARRGVEPLFPG